MSAVEITGVDFATIFVDDWPPAVEFYANVLGLEKTVDYGKVDGCEFETGNLTLQLMNAPALGQVFTPSGHPIALHVDDVEAARADLEAKGVAFVAETIDSGVCHMAIFQDPAGNTLMFHNRYAPRG